jgi:hypothetical protein
MREALLYIVFPDQFESISSRNDKALIREAFKDRLEKGPTDNIDADVLAIRRQLTIQQGKEIHFYRSPIIEQWKTEKQKTGPTRLKEPLPGGHLRPLTVPGEHVSRLEDLNELAAELFLDPPKCCIRGPIFFWRLVS